MQSVSIFNSNYTMNPFQQQIDQLIESGLAYEDMDGCVRLCPGIVNGMLPNINIQFIQQNNCGNTYNTYNNTYNFYGDNATNNDIHENNLKMH